MSFKEYLIASGESVLVKQIDNFCLDKPLPNTAHKKLVNKQREYLFIGGMPESILTYIQEKSLTGAREVHRSIIQTYRDDFSKYARQTELMRLQHVFDTLPQMVGKKIKYSNISRDERSTGIKTAINLLIKAQLYTPAYHSDCSGVPLRAGKDEKIYKLYFLDIGLLNYLQGLDWKSIADMEARTLVNEGVLAKQYIAQHLAYRFEGLESPELFYWLRERKSSNAEIDFVVSKGAKIVPIEVKAGKSGGLKSLQQFLLHKKTSMACRFDINTASIQDPSYQIPLNGTNTDVNYRLLSLPLYLVERLMNLID